MERSPNPLSNSVLLISGGTGSFGNAVMRRFLDSDIAEIRILSRDEKKQDDIRKKYNSKKLKFYISDVRDQRSIEAAVIGADYIFHAAALKQVPSCEFYPIEAVKTNILGTENILDAAIKYGVKRVVCLSTDKAVYPINAMGMSKALMEKTAVAKSRISLPSTTVCVTRYGNVMASRGSVIPLFVNQVLSGQPISITDPEMTRFMMTLDDAVDLVLHAFVHGENGDVFVQKAPAATIAVLAKAVTRIMGKPDHPITIMGTRHGEKLYETLLSREEMVKAEDLGAYYRVPPDLRDLNYDIFVDVGDARIQQVAEYNSHNTQQLDEAGMIELLRKLRFVQSLERGEQAVPEE
jgi:UDP-N-acetylglucosamine 4,6-dehydratase/5-epimerase